MPNQNQHTPLEAVQPSGGTKVPGIASPISIDQIDYVKTEPYIVTSG